MRRLPTAVTQGFIVRVGMTWLLWMLPLLALAGYIAGQAPELDGGFTVVAPEGSRP